MEVEKPMVIIPQKGTDHPALKYLYAHVRGNIANYWYDIGVALLDPGDQVVLDTINKNHPGDAEKCAAEMLKLWLARKPKASWDLLLEALKEPHIKLNTLAVKIEEMLTKVVKQHDSTVNDKKEDILLPDFSKFRSVSSAFVCLISTVTECLESKKFNIIRRACIAQINSPSGAQLPPDVVQKIQNAENLDALLDTLTTTKYWSWIDLRLLETLVVASGSSTALDIVNKYRETVYSMKLVDVLPNVPNKEVKDAYFTKIISKIGKDSHEITVGVLVELRSKLERVIMDINQGTCVLEHIEDGCIQIHWFIPTHHIDHAYEVACLRQHKFHELCLLSLQIGNYPVLCDPYLTSSSSTVVTKPSPPITADTSKCIIDHFNHYLCTEMDTNIVVQQMLTQQLLNDEEVENLMNATSDYQKNCLLLEKIRLMDMQALELFCKVLQYSDSQKHIADVLINALDSFGFLRIDTLSPSKTVQASTACTDSENSQTDTISIRPKGKSDTTTKSSFKASLVVTEFLDMKNHLENMLQSCNAQNIYKKCKKLMASHAQSIPLFSDVEYLRSLKECKLAPAILQKLSPFFTWSDHSVLAAAVKACNNSKAVMLLQHFDAQLDLSLPITEYSVPQPVSSMAPYETSMQTVLGIKLNTELSKISLQQVLELRHSVQKSFQITEHSLQLMAVESNANILYWVIPKCISHLISSKIMQNPSLHGGRVQEVSVYPGTLFISVSVLNIGSLSFLNQVSVMSQNNENKMLPVQLNNLEGMVQIETDQSNDQSEQVEVITSSEQPKMTSPNDTKAILKHSMDTLVKFGNWMAYLPQCVLEEQQIKFGMSSTSTLLVGYYHGLLLRDANADSLMGDLFSIGLLSAQEQNIILSGHSSHHRNWLLLEHVRHMDSQALLVFSELVKNVWPQIGMQLVTALTSNDDDDNLYSASQEENDTSLVFGIRFSYIEASSVLTVFFQVFDFVIQLLATCNVEVLLDVCENLLASCKHAINFFSDNQIKMLKNCDSSLLLLQRLSLFFTWSNHSILRVLADHCSKAVNILDVFDCRVDSFELIASYPIPCFSLSMIPYDSSSHTIVAIRCDQELYESTLQYVYDMQSVMMEKCDITQHCLHLLAVRSDPTILYWTIPKCVVCLINDNASLNSEYLYSRGILEVLVYPDLVFTFGDHVSIGLLAFSDDLKLIEAKYEHQEYQKKIGLLQETVECLKTDKKIKEEQLEGLRAELSVKKSLTSDQQLLYKRMTDIKLENYEHQECQKKIGLLQETVECLKTDKKIKEEQLEGLCAELSVKKSLTSDQQLLYKRMTDIKLENDELNEHNMKLLSELKEIEEKKDELNKQNMKIFSEIKEIKEKKDGLNEQNMKLLSEIKEKKTLI